MASIVGPPPFWRRNVEGYVQLFFRVPNRLCSLGIYAVAVAALVSGCASRDIPPDPGPPMEPRASWTIRAGKLGGQGGIVCRSNVALACVITLAESDEGAFASVAMYLYAAGAKTTYKGVFFVSFIGDTGYESAVTYEIDPGDVPTLVSVFGTVVKAPGSYEFRLALAAEVPGHGEPHQFQVAIPVTVVAPPGKQAQN